MKHIKTFETLLIDMTPGMMYQFYTDNGIPLYTFGFLGVNRNKEFFLACIEFNKYKASIVEFKNVDCVPLNMSIKDYIINIDKESEVEFIERILDLLKNPDYGSKFTRKLCNNFYHELLEDSDIQAHIQSKKYNL